MRQITGREAGRRFCTSVNSTTMCFAGFGEDRQQPDPRHRRDGDCGGDERLLLAGRDALDQGRTHDPLREASDAFVVDTSDLSVAEIVGESGDPASLILATAQDRDASMIVVGTHDRNWLARLFHPSVSQAILQDARRPILIMSTSVPDDDADE